MIRRLLHDERVFRTAHAAAHAARVFTAAVLLSLLLVHLDEGPQVVAPLAVLTVAVILAPALLERRHANPSASD